MPGDPLVAKFCCASTRRPPFVRAWALTGRALRQPGLHPLRAGAGADTAEFFSTGAPTTAPPTPFPAAQRHFSGDLPRDRNYRIGCRTGWRTFGRRISFEVFLPSWYPRLRLALKFEVEHRAPLAVTQLLARAKSGHRIANLLTRRQSQGYAARVTTLRRPSVHVTAG